MKNVNFKAFIMNLNNKLFILLLFFFIGACTTAKKATDIQAARTPVAPYLKMDCKELVTEQQLVLKDVEATGVQVDKQYNSEKTTELVTWILFAPAAFFLEGNDANAGKLAAYKGQLDAINEALKINKCGVN